MRQAQLGTIWVVTRFCSRRIDGGQIQKRRERFPPFECNIAQSPRTCRQSGSTGSGLGMVTSGSSGAAISRAGVSTAGFAGLPLRPWDSADIRRLDRLALAVATAFQVRTAAATAARAPVAALAVFAVVAVVVETVRTLAALTLAVAGRGILVERDFGRRAVDHRLRAGAVGDRRLGFGVAVAVLRLSISSRSSSMSSSNSSRWSRTCWIGICACAAAMMRL